MALNDYFIQHDFKRLLAPLTLLLLTLLLIITLSADIFQWYQDWQLAHTVPAIKMAAPIAITAHSDRIIKAHLFGQALNQVGDVPISNQHFSVTGIMFYEEQSKASIVSIANNQQEKVYQIGDKLPSGASVYAITSNAVILKNDGKLEKLPLLRNPLEFKPQDQEVSH